MTYQFNCAKSLYSHELWGCVCGGVCPVIKNKRLQQLTLSPLFTWTTKLRDLERPPSSVEFTQQKFSQGRNIKWFIKFVAQDNNDAKRRRQEVGRKQMQLGIITCTDHDCQQRNAGLKIRLLARYISTERYCRALQARRPLIKSLKKALPT